MKSGPGGAALLYDPAGRLYQTSKGAFTTRMQYDGSDLIAEYNAANVLQRRALRLYPSPGWLRSSLHGPGTDEPILWYEGAALTSLHPF
jgi:YD repeat-containing protein